jgi:hypothetical protein
MVNSFVTDYFPDLINDSAKEIDCYNIEGCIEKDKKKCDYLLINLTDSIVFLVELKGSDILHAISQIDSTLDIVLIIDFIKHN